MDRRKKTTGKIKGMFHTSGTKHGSYSVGLTVLVIAIVIVFNLVIGQIPEAYRNLVQRFMKFQIQQRIC